MEENTKILEIGKILQEANVDEAEAIVFYMEKLKEVAEIDEEIAEKIAPTIQEIVSDELNHIQLTQKLYTQITGIEENKE